MSQNPEVSAAAAADSYKDRPQSDVDKSKPVFLKGQEYLVFGYKDDPATGFHATAYQNKITHEVIIAYRGTDPDLKGHTRTTVQDAVVDFTMVKARVNTQESAAHAFTQEMLDKAQKHGISKDHVSVAGHSLGGALAEIEAWKFGLRGATYNGYGAVDLNYGVPEGGRQVTNYVMAGDVVSAGSHHFGEMKVLASKDDVANLQAGRYLNAPSGSLPPNPLLAMSLGDHSITNFTGEGGKENVLALVTMSGYAARYEQNRAAFDHYRDDVYQDRAELGEVLRRADSHDIATTLVNMPPHLQQQLLELHAAKVDMPIQQAVEHNRLVRGAQQGLDDAAAGLRKGGERVQQSAEEASQGVRVAGQAVQRHTDDVARAGLGFATIDPLAGVGMALGAKAAGYTVRAEAEGVAQASHLAGQVTHVATQLAAEQVQSVKHVVELGAHVTAQSAKTVVHVLEAEVVFGVDSAIDSYQHLKEGIGKIDMAAHRAYHSAEHAASQAYDTLTHPGQWFGHASAPSPTTPSTAPMHTQVQAVTPTSPGHARNDPRHPDNPDHALYNELHRRIPEASENRLLQFTAACHTNRITADNLSTIHLDETSGKIGFVGSGYLSTPSIVDLNDASPQPRQSIQNIQQHDQQQTQMMGQMQAQNAQVNQQGPMLGGP